MFIGKLEQGRTTKDSSEHDGWWLRAAGARQALLPTVLSARIGPDTPLVPWCYK